MFFVLLSVFLCLIFFFKATDVIPRDPASIATAATLVASSSTLAKIFENLGHASDADLEHFLYKSSYRSRMVSGAESGFIIERNETSHSISITSDKNLDYWRPFPTSWLFVVSASLYTCALIVVMEVFGHLSHRGQGIASIHVSSTWAHEFSTVIPAVTMLVASECYKAANDTVSSFMPFSSLYRGGVTQHLYRKYMALLIHNNMRHPLPSSSSDSSPTYPGTIMDLTALRVVQNPASKVALEVLLATMLIFTAIAYIMTPMRNVLPHSPCTIAGVMSLLADSDLCRRAVIPEGAEFMTDEELEKVFKGYLFSLGWFGAGGGGEGGGEERFGIDVGRADKAG